jgi:hypothetical protein
MNATGHGLLSYGVAALILSILTSACSPMTPVRRTLYAPRPALPARIGAPLEAGHLRAFAQLNSAEFIDPVAPVDPIGPFSEFTMTQIGDPGVLTPRLQLGAGAYLGVNDFLEFGGQFTYSQMQWTRSNTVGVLPFPESEGRHLIVGGLGVRLNSNLGQSGFTLSMMAELNLGALPQAYFECIHEACRDSTRTSLSAEDDVRYYRLDRVEHKQVLLPQGAVQLNFSPLRSIGIFALFGVQANYRNVGFDPDPDSLDQHSLKSYAISTAGLGMDLTLPPLTMTLAAFTPLHHDRRIPVGPSLVVQTGLTF